MRRLTLLAVVAVAAVLGLGACGGAVPGVAAPQASTAVPAPKLDEHGEGDHESVVLAGGCFWGVQGVFQHVKGVTNAVSGYAGGDQADATYDVVSSGTTGHAESVQVTFDPSVVSLGTLLRIYFSVVHDPTQLDHQGPDHGTQYRSTIFPTTASQAKVARAYISQLDKAKVFDDPVVTTVEPDRTFYPAEAYHQNYLTEHPHEPYIAINDMPKVKALEQDYPAHYRTKPALVR